MVAWSSLPEVQSVSDGFIPSIFARAGARIVIADIAAEAGEKVADRICGQGGEAIFVRTDISEEAQTLNLAKVAVERFGRIDALSTTPRS